MHFLPYIQVREETHSSGVVHPGHRARLCQRIRQFLHSIFGSAVLHRLLSDRNQPHLHRVMQVEEDFTTKTLSKCYNSDLFCSDPPPPPPAGVEWADTPHRSFMGVIGSLSWSLGNMLLAAFAYLVNDWRMLILTVTSPLGLAILTWW